VVERGALFLDDAYMYSPPGRDFAETHRKIELIMERNGGVFDWSEEGLDGVAEIRQDQEDRRADAIKTLF
jgi:hypothetical protein